MVSSGASVRVVVSFVLVVGFAIMLSVSMSFKASPFRDKAIVESTEIGSHDVVLSVGIV